MSEQVSEDIGESKAKSTPFWLFYTSDWAGGTIGFTLEQRGFYHEALCRMWERKDGLIDDVKWLGAACRCDPRTARRLRGFLINQKKFHIRNGLLINRRVMKDIAEWKRKSKAKIAEMSGEDQPEFGLIFPENDGDSKVVPFSRGGISDHHQNPKEEKKERSSSSSGRTDDDDDRLRRLSISVFTRLKLVEFIGEEPADHLIQQYLSTDYARAARSIEHAFRGWLRKLGIDINGPRRSLSTEQMREVYAMCGTDANGKPSIELPTTVSKPSKGRVA